MARRNEIELAEDRARVVELYKKGYRSKTEIASIINEKKHLSSHIRPEQVSQDIEAIKKKYLDTTLQDFSAYRTQLLDELQLLKKTFWEGYLLSTKNKVSIESEAIIDDETYRDELSGGLGLKPNEDVFLRNAKTKEELRIEGNVSYLQGVLAVIDREARMVGVDAPSKVALTDPSGTKSLNVFDVMKQSMDELANRINEDSEKEVKLLKPYDEEEIIND